MLKEHLRTSKKALAAEESQHKKEEAKTEAKK